MPRARYASSDALHRALIRGAGEWMPRQNRVTPWGAIIATPERGTLMGNRGCLHDDAGQIRRPYRSMAWIFCTLAYRGRRQAIMAPNRYTQLFFLDEATALAAGHRPCALCRREDHERFMAIWRERHPDDRGLDAIDARLHAERVDQATREHRCHQASLDALPDGSFVLHHGGPWLVLSEAMLRWTPAGFAQREPRPRHERATLITPPSLVEVLQTGWVGAVPLLHPTAISPIAPS